MNIPAASLLRQLSSEKSYDESATRHLPLKTAFTFREFPVDYNILHRDVARVLNRAPLVIFNRTLDSTFKDFFLCENQSKYFRLYAYIERCRARGASCASNL